jgi:hypothetical protein
MAKKWKRKPKYTIGDTFVRNNSDEVYIIVDVVHNIFKEPLYLISVGDTVGYLDEHIILYKKINTLVPVRLHPSVVYKLV